MHQLSSVLNSSSNYPGKEKVKQRLLGLSIVTSLESAAAIVHLVLVKLLFDRNARPSEGSGDFVELGFQLFQPFNFCKLCSIFCS